MNAAYRLFVHAAEAKDVDALTRIIRSHKELHHYVGDDGSLLDVIGYNCPELFEASFEAGLHPDSGPQEPSQTFLQHVAAESDVELVRLALRYGAVVERRNCAGETALGYAASWGSLEVVRALVEAGVDVNAVEGKHEGQLSTALDSAFRRPEIRRYLVEHGAKSFAELHPPD